MRLLTELVQKRSGLDYIETLLRYVSQGSDKVNRDDLRQAVEQAFTRGEEIMATIAEE